VDQTNKTTVGLKTFGNTIYFNREAYIYYRVSHIQGRRLSKILSELGYTADKNVFLKTKSKIEYVRIDIMNRKFRHSSCQQHSPIYERLPKKIKPIREKDLIEDLTWLSLAYI